MSPSSAVRRICQFTFEVRARAADDVPMHCLHLTAADPPLRVPCVYERAGTKYIAYESMSEKREIMKEMELADREAARVARKAAAPAR